MSNSVFVIDAKKQPLNPIRPGLARKLLTNGKAAVFRSYPFTKTINKPTIVNQGNWTRYSPNVSHR
jgi:RRXRR protein